MADVFVSYAKADRSLALKLVAMLEAEGWKVWWDTSLAIGDDFRNEIMTELGRARAVIVIWTDTSVKSDWVRSEAGRAQADRKLIPVKLAQLTYNDLPPPFDVLHTENVSEDDKIRAAVVAQLAKPAMEPTAAALLVKGLKYQLLTWGGIVGGTLTLFGHVSSGLTLTHLARLLVDNWTKWAHDFWLWIFARFGIFFPPIWTSVLSFLLFLSVLIVGQAIQFNSAIKKKTSGDKYNDKSFHLMSWRTLICAVSSLLSIIVVIITIYVSRQRRDPDIIDITLMLFSAIVVPSAIIALFARHRLQAATTAVLVSIFMYIIVIGHLVKLNIEASQTDWLGHNLFFLLLAPWISPLIALIAAPAKAINRRLIFLGIGVILLIALNELSKLGPILARLFEQS